MLSKAELMTPDHVSGVIGNSRSEDVFLFDLNAIVPGTFCQIDHDFADYLLEFARLRPCYLLASVSYNDLLSRLPSRVRFAFKGIFVSSGAELWCEDEVLERREHRFSDDLYEHLVKVVQNSGYQEKVAPLIENGPATLRVCLAGTQATIGQLKAYLKWEEEHCELPKIVNELRAKFPDHEVCQDSGSSLLISPNTFSSALVRQHITTEHEGARFIGYMSNRAVNSFARPLCDVLSGADLLTEVGGPSDLSQLMSYDIRRASARDLLAAE
ncbi:hypothetical protein IWQ49_006498 [Labrenzia sp. EL_126]|nr:hypothetical protein [Labrenzia sp. EL_126]